MTKAIKLHGIKNINLHLIDAAFTDYIEACFFENKKVESIDVSNDIDQKLQTFIDQVSMQNKEKNSLQATSYAIQLAIQHEEFRQLASLLHILSDGNIQIYIYPNAQAYKECCLNNNDMLADIISAIDFEPDGHFYVPCIMDYYSLMYDTLKQDGVAIFSDRVSNFDQFNLFDRIFNKNCVSVHTKKATCPLGYFENIIKRTEAYEQSNDIVNSKKEILKINNNEFVTRAFEFKYLSAIQALHFGALTAGLMYYAIHS